MHTVEVMPLGGCGEVGKNLTAVRQNGEIILIDVGLSFPSAELHGVELVIPDFTFLRENARQVRAVVLTHAHEDHVGALPYFLQEFNVPVYGSPLTIAIAKRKVAEGLDVEAHPFVEFKCGETFQIGSFQIEPTFVTHSIPDSHAIAIRTQLGTLLFTGDFKFDFSPIDGRTTQLARFAEFGTEGVLALFCDSTNVEEPGWSPSERSVRKGFEDIFRSAPGRILITCFGSNIHRVQQAFDVADEFGRKVAIAGRSMEQNVNTAIDQQRLNINSDTRIKLDEARKYRNDELVILTTGTQGEPLAALSLMARAEYPRMQIEPGDTVIYSARPIPGNERAIWQTVNRLIRQGAHVIYGQQHSIHASGHGYREEIKLMISLTRPHYIAPVHGEPRQQAAFCRMAEEMGYSSENMIVMENGDHLVFEKDEAYLAEPVACGRVLVDTSGTPGVSDDLLRDRKNLATGGIVLISVAIDSDAGRIVGPPDILARGVHALNGELDQLREVIEGELKKLSHADLRDTSAVNNDITELAKRFLNRAANKRPLIITNVTDV